MQHGSAIVVIPTYNERENLPLVCEQVMQHTGGAVHILVVDDNSPDGTGELADALARQHPQIHVLHRQKKEGLGRAYVAGFKQALQMGHALIAQMDADLSHDPRDLPRLIETATAHADVVTRFALCARRRRQQTGRAGATWLSRFANIYVRHDHRACPFVTATGGYRCWRREVLEAINLDTVRSNGYAFQIEMAYRACRLGFHVQEIPIVFTERRAGKSKLSRRVIWEAIWLPWKLRFSRAYNSPCTEQGVSPPV
jgi:dolichol-phosphate mannosyltransferase